MWTSEDLEKECTFNNVSEVVFSIAKTRKVLVNLNTPLELPAQQITFVQEKNELSLHQEWGRADGCP